MPCQPCGTGQARAPDDAEAARIASVFALLARLDDINLLHRGGARGLAAARAAARGFCDAGGIAAANWRGRAVGIHRAFVARRRSPGGCADRLAPTPLLEALDGDDG